LSKASRVLAKSEIMVVDGIGGEKIDFELKTLTGREMLEMSDLLEKDMKGGIVYIVLTTLKKTIPDVTKEEINDMPAGILMEIANKVMEISGLGTMFSQKKSQSDLKTMTGTRQSIIESLDKKLAAGEL